MKQILRKTLLLIGVFLGGISSAWADGEIPFVAGNTIGDENNSGGWFYGISEVINIPANKTLTLKFKTYSATDGQLVGKGDGGTNLPWGAHMSHILRIGNDGDDLYWRSDGYGWKGSNNTNSGDWFKCNLSNTRWGEGGADFRADITGSDVVLTIARVGAELRITQDIFTASDKYTKYFVLDYGTANGNIWAQLVVERAHVVVSANKELSNTITTQGTLLGLDNNTGAFGAGTRLPEFTVAPNGTLKLHFKNYTSKIANYMNWAFEMECNGQFSDIVTGGNNWGALQGGDNAASITDTGWPTNGDFRNQMDGADVVLTVTRSGATVTGRAVMTPVSGSAFTRDFSFTSSQDGFASANATVRLLTDHSHIDLLPESIEIGATGWGTFASDYNLDFTGITDIEAYKVTGATGSAIDKAQLTGIVPAGTPMLLNAPGGTGTYTVPVATSAGTPITGNCLLRGKGEAVAQDGSHDRYVLVKEKDGTTTTAKFKKILSNPATVAANRAYLQFNKAVSPSRDILSIDGGDATGINMVNGEGLKINGSEVYYNLQGQRVLYPTKGLYIVNGKKVVIK